MSRELATLHTRVEIPEEIEFYRLKEGNQKELVDFFQTMKFNSLIREMSAPTCKAALHVDRREYHLIDDEAGLTALLARLSKEKEVGIDTETTDISPLLAHLVGIGFGVEPGEAWYVPLNGDLGKKKVLEALRPFFGSAECSFYGHHIKYDYHILQNVGMPLRSISFDTLLASYLLEPQNRRHGLDDLTLEKFQKVKIPIESLIGKGKKEISMRDVPRDKVKDYCCEDIDYTTRSKELFERELKAKKLMPILTDVELPLLPISAKMETTGIYLDLAELSREGRGLSGK